ncbi:MAG: hypothetical protein JW881_05335 [Spirochaetales bacterium]|nr:hypothetical protein [Spirochaetales bacterium]
MTRLTEKRPHVFILAIGYILSMFAGAAGAIMGLYVLIKYRHGEVDHGRGMLFLSFVSLLSFVLYYFIIVHFFEIRELYIVLSPVSLFCFGLFRILQKERQKRENNGAVVRHDFEHYLTVFVGMYPFIVGIWGLIVILFKLDLFPSWPLRYGLRLAGCLLNTAIGCLSLLRLPIMKRQDKKKADSGATRTGFPGEVFFSGTWPAFFLIFTGILIMIYELVLSYYILL